MKGKLLVILALVLTLTMAIPMTVFAASNATTLSKLKIGGVKKYDTALPKNGEKKTEKEINKLLNKLPWKPSGKGDSMYYYDLNFSRLNTDKPGTYQYAEANKGYSKYDSKKKRSMSYGESKSISSPKEGTYCYIYKEDSKYWYNYNWKKGEKTGTFYKSKKTSGGGGSTTKYTNYRLYSDQKVLGDKCLVYSYDIEKYNETIYRFVSRKTGVERKYISVASEYTYTMVNFETKRVSKKNSFFDLPKNVKFTEAKSAQPKKFSMPREAAA